MMATPLMTSNILSEHQIQMNEVDLSLEIEVDQLHPPIYEEVTFKLQIHNDGPEPSGEVKIALPIPTHIAYTGHWNSQGIYDAFAGIWTVDAVAANSLEELQLTLYTLSLDPITVFAQVITMDGIDKDSAPDNNGTTTPFEDDEVVITIFPGDGTPDLRLENLLSYELGSPGSITPVYVDIVNQGSAAVGESFELFAYISQDDMFSDEDSIIGSITLSDIPIGTIQSVKIDLNIPWDVVPGIHNLLLKVDPIDEVFEMNEQNNELGASLMIVEPTQNTTDPDLAIQLSTNSSSFGIYERVSFTLMIENTGGAAAKDILVSLPIPEDMAFVEFLTSEGHYNSYYQHWELSGLEVGQKEMLELTLFTLQNQSPYIVFSQVTVATPLEDADSQPGNAECCVPLEDDEAVITILPEVTDRSRTLAEPIYAGQKLSVYSVFPNPVEQRLNVWCNTFLTELSYVIVNELGAQMDFGQFQTVEGFQKLEFDVTRLTPGKYFLLFETGTKVKPIPFMKYKI